MGIKTYLYTAPLKPPGIYTLEFSWMLFQQVKQHVLIAARNTNLNLAQRLTVTKRI